MLIGFMQIENKLSQPIVITVETNPDITIPSNQTVDVYLEIKKMTIKPSA